VSADALASAESFVCWSKDRVASKAIVSATQIFILRQHAADRPDPIIVGKQIFATHYLDGALDITTLVGPEGDGPRYLVYVNRTSVDLLAGFWGGIVRRVIESTVTDEAPDVLRGVRQRLEAGRR
jgi:hypothetical protein